MLGVATYTLSSEFLECVVDDNLEASEATIFLVEKVRCMLVDQSHVP